MDSDHARIRYKDMHPDNMLNCSIYQMPARWQLSPTSEVVGLCYMLILFNFKFSI